MNVAIASGANTMVAMTKGLPIPHGRMRLIANMADVTPTPSVNAPAVSKLTSGRRAVSLNSGSAIAHAMNAGTAWMTKSARQPMASTAGPPITTPSTGARPPATLSRPMARARLSAGSCAATSAMAAVPVAPPPI